MYKAIVVLFHDNTLKDGIDNRWPFFIENMEMNGIIPTVISPSEVSFNEPLKTNFKTYYVPFNTKIKIKAKVETEKLPKQNPSLITELLSEVKKNIKSLNEYFQIPDTTYPWVKKVIPLVNKLLLSDRFDFIITCGPPQSVHLIGLEVSKKHQIHWVSDFDRIWINEFNQTDKLTYLAERKNVFLENEVLLKSNTVITSNSSIKSILSKKTNHEKDKFFEIISGFDSKLIKSVTKSKRKVLKILQLGDMENIIYYSQIIEVLSKLKGSHELVKLDVFGMKVIELPLVEMFQNVKIESHQEQFKRQNFSQIYDCDLIIYLLPYRNFSLFSDTLSLELLHSGKPCIFVGSILSENVNRLKNYEGIYILKELNKDFLNLEIENSLKLKFPLKNINIENLKYSKQESVKRLCNILIKRLNQSKPEIDSLYV